MNYLNAEGTSLNTLPVDLGASLRIQISKTSDQGQGVIFLPDGTVTEAWFDLSSSAGTRQLRLDPVRAKVTTENS